MKMALFELNLHIPFLKGLITTASLYVAIGPQNAFVLRQGVTHNYILLTALFCTLSNVILIGLGIAGLGRLLAQNQTLMLIARWGGILFLFLYGLKLLISIFGAHFTALKVARASEKPPFKETVITLAAVSFLNPFIYLSVILISSIGSQFDFQQRLLFACGAICFTLVWFFILAFGARLLAPLFAKPLSWKIFDIVIVCMIWTLALSMIFIR